MSFPKKLFAFDRALFFIIAGIAILALIFGCKNENVENTAFAKASVNPTTSVTMNAKQRVLSQEWQDYWYAGKAEITSYKLSQSRYGELREGTAALIYVTEDFLAKEQVKADRQNDDNIPVLKLNATKNFVTGIYPYSVMNSTFYPVKEERHAIKISQSMQEWCGHVYTQLNNRNEFEITSHSYFESEADQDISIPKTILENELWTQLRLDPDALPVGNLRIIPNLEFVSMRHIKLAAYDAIATLTEGSYRIEYPELKRTVTINFSSKFPHTVEGWTESTQDNRSGKLMTTTATKIKTIKSAYWGKNSVADEYLRKELGL